MVERGEEEVSDSGDWAACESRQDLSISIFANVVAISSLSVGSSEPELEISSKANSLLR